MKSLKLVLAIGLLSFCGASNAGLIYDVYQHYDQIRPDATPGDPLDKGFSLSGTITAPSTGFFGDGANPFVDWNITELVDTNADLVPDITYTFNPANSSWDLAQTGDLNLPVLEITESFIWLIDLSDLVDPSNAEDNTLTLESPASDLDQTVTYYNPRAANFLFVSGQTSVPNNINGVYEGSAGRVLVATRQSVPEPGILALWGIGALGLVWHRRRRNAA